MQGSSGQTPPTGFGVSSLQKGPWTEAELVYLDTIPFFEKWSMENR